VREPEGRPKRIPREITEHLFSFKNTTSAAPQGNNSVFEALAYDSDTIDELRDPKNNISTLMTWLDDHLYYEKE